MQNPEKSLKITNLVIHIKIYIIKKKIVGLRTSKNKTKTKLYENIFFFPPQTTKTVTKNINHDDKIKDIKPA